MGADVPSLTGGWNPAGTEEHLLSPVSLKPFHLLGLAHVPLMHPSFWKVVEMSKH